MKSLNSGTVNARSPCAGLMHRHDQRAQFLLVEILNLINEDGHGYCSLLGCFAYGDEEVRKVNFQIATIRRALFGFDIQSYGDIPHGEFEGADL